VTGMTAVMWRGRFLHQKGRSEIKKVYIRATLSLGAAVRLASSLHSAFELTIGFRLAYATLSVTIDGKRLLVTEYMFIDASLD